MKIFYIVNARIPTEKAHGYQICKMCEEFSSAGVEVELIVPQRDNDIKENIFSFYDLKNNFKVRYIKSFDFLKYEKYLRIRSFYFYNLYFLIKLFFQKIDKDAIIYTRSAEIGWIFKIRGFDVVCEMHNLPVGKRFFLKEVIKKINKFVVITKGLESDLLNIQINDNKILVAPDGVDMDKFNINISKNEARKQMCLPLEKSLVIYTGHLYDWKGAQYLAEAARLLKKEIITIFIGGTESDIMRFRKKYGNIDNILIVGKKPYKEMPLYMKAADILVLPNTRKDIISEKYTSPLKMFEYMASKRPIIASNLPSIREVLNKKNSFLIESENFSSLANAINYVLKNKELSEKISQQAFSDVENYIWSKRARKIINFINN